MEDQIEAFVAQSYLRNKTKPMNNTSTGEPFPLDEETTLKRETILTTKH